MIVFDLDGTLSLVGDRVKELQKDPPDWDAFYERCGEDEPNVPILMLCNNLLEDGHRITIVTGRREGVFKKTVRWLTKHSHWGLIDGLYMRPDGDFRHDTILKPELVAPFADEIELIFEDRSSMVKKW